MQYWQAEEDLAEQSIEMFLFAGDTWDGQDNVEGRRTM